MVARASGDERCVAPLILLPMTLLIQGYTSGSLRRRNHYEVVGGSKLQEHDFSERTSCTERSVPRPCLLRVTASLWCGLKESHLNPCDLFWMLKSVITPGNSAARLLLLSILIGVYLQDIGKHCSVQRKLKTPQLSTLGSMANVLQSISKL